MDGWRDNWTDIRMNGRAEGHSVCQMDEWTTRRIDRPTDGERYAEVSSDFDLLPLSLICMQYLK